MWNSIVSVPDHCLFSFINSKELLQSRFKVFVNRKNVLQKEPRHDKTNKMSERPTKTQISQGIRPV